MKYNEDDVTDFVLDENFKQWVLTPSAQNSAFWEDWISKNPEKRTAIHQAKQMILMLYSIEDHPEKHDFQTAWNTIIQAIDESQNNAPSSD